MFSGSKVPDCHFTEPTLKNHAYLWLNLWPNETQSLSINTWNKNSSIKGDYWGFVVKQKITFLILINWIIKNNSEISQSEKAEWDNSLQQALTTANSSPPSHYRTTLHDQLELTMVSWPHWAVLDSIKRIGFIRDSNHTVMNFRNWLAAYLYGNIQFCYAGNLLSIYRILLNTMRFTL